MMDTFRNVLAPAGYYILHYSGRHMGVSLCRRDTTFVGHFTWDSMSGEHAIRFDNKPHIICNSDLQALVTSACIYDRLTTTKGRRDDAR